MTAGHELSAVTRLAPAPVCVGLAREWGRKALAEWDLVEHTDIAELLVSELLTNAVRYGGDGQIQVRMSYRAGTLRIEVRDGGSALPERRQAADDETRGRGLALVDALLAEHNGIWGVSDHTPGPGKTVFVALALAAADPC